MKEGKLIEPDQNTGSHVKETVENASLDGGKNNWHWAVEAEKERKRGT